jgi:hyperosmotically inducible protein
MRTKFFTGVILRGSVLGALCLGVGAPAMWAHGPASNAVPPVQEGVRHALVMIPYLSVFDDLSFQIDNGTVTLTGAVTQPFLKDSAEKAVQRVPGVTAVNDQIEVLPLSPFDDRIRVQTLRALARTPSVNRYFAGTIPSIRIIVKNGHVTLDGVVDRAADSQLAYVAANQVPGVFSVTNDLRVEVR